MTPHGRHNQKGILPGLRNVTPRAWNPGLCDNAQAFTPFAGQETRA